MLGLMLNRKERQEMEYLLKKELEELLLDLEDKRLDGFIRAAMEDRYKVVFRLYARFVSPAELSKYIRHRSQQV